MNRLIVPGFVTLIALMVFVVAVLVQQLSATTDELRASVQVYNQKSSSLTEMYHIKQRRNLLLVQMYAEPDPFERDNYYLQYLELGGRFIELREAYSTLEVMPEERGAWDRLARLTQRHAEMHRDLVALVYDGAELTELRAILLGSRNSQIEESTAIRELLHVVREQEHALLQRAEGKLSGTSILSVAILLVAVALGVLITRRVARDARDVEEGLQAQVFKAESMSRELAWHASHDSLTKLTNRREFKRQLERLCQRARAEKVAHGLLVLDLDQFKIVNDSCGHAAGDTLLRQLAATMRRVLPAQYTLGRLGGDEFGVLMPQVSIRTALETAETLRALIQDYRFVWRGRIFELAVSIGVATINRDLSDASEAMTAADSACYRAKNEGRNRIHVFSGRDRWWNQEKQQSNWTHQIPQAIRDNRLVLHAQEIRRVDGQTPQHRHYELLVRMLDDAGGLVTPASFVPVAERFGLAPELDRAIIRQAFTWIGNLTRQLRTIHPDLVNEELSSFSINLSGQSLSDHELLDEVLELFERHEVLPRQICFEITETAVITNLQAARDFIQRLKEVGCRFALDDFGSGVSSFGYLKGLDVDYIKIDGKIVRQMQNGSVECAIVEAIAHVAREMRVQTVAEFAENDWTINTLRRLGVDFAQGYFVHRPQPLDDIDTSLLPQRALFNGALVPLTKPGEARRVPGRAVSGRHDSPRTHRVP
ncbi:MAG: putative bifunctional diguanylate cyclase/phosphodiesterase [Thiotrichales bacterium]